jgi:hypothetical protein
LVAVAVVTGVLVVVLIESVARDGPAASRIQGASEAAATRHLRFIKGGLSCAAMG